MYHWKVAKNHTRKQLLKSMSLVTVSDWFWLCWQDNVSLPLSIARTEHSYKTTQIGLKTSGVVINRLSESSYKTNTDASIWSIISPYLFTPDKGSYSVDVIVPKKGVNPDFIIFFGKNLHTNWNIPSNLNWAKIWSILLQYWVRVHTLSCVQPYLSI